MIVGVQSWPFYVGASTSSNINPGTFTQEFSTDDGSWMVLAPNQYTYAQPANFQGVTGLTAGTAVTHSGVLTGTVSTSGTFTIAAQPTCGANLYWITWEYFEGAGGGADIEYSWQIPGGLTKVQNTQGVVYGQVLRNGSPASGDTVTVSVPGNATQSLTTDANGCYGYNYQPFASAQSITIKATDAASTTLKTATLASGAAQVANFSFPTGTPGISLYKRLTQIVRGGTTITPTPDPTSPAGVGGSSSYGAGVFPGDVLTYSIYFLNTGTTSAYGATTSSGPTISDPLQAALGYMAGSATQTCCINATATDTPIFSSNGQNLTWVLPFGLGPYVTSSTNAYQGVLTFQAAVR